MRGDAGRSNQTNHEAARTQVAVGDSKDVGSAAKREVMSEEPGSDRVTARTRAFEEIDAQVFAGPGRGATRSEAAASDWWGRPSPAIVEAYRRMFDLVAKHSERLSHRDRRLSAASDRGIRV